MLKAKTAIKYILVSKQAKEKYEARVNQIIAHFNIKPVFVDAEDNDTVTAAIKKLVPETAKGNAQAVTHGKKILLITGTSKGSSLVSPFEFDKDVVCPHFFEVKPMSNGCLYSCQYCYLQATYRSMWPCLKLNVNYEDIIKQMKSTAKKRKEDAKGPLPTYFNMGELLDSLALEPVTGAFEFLQQHMEDDAFEHSELMLLTKSNEVGALIKGAKKYPKSVSRIVVTWSLNSPYAAKKYELGSASIVQRLQAAQKVQKAGYKIRLRIDPMIPRQNDKHLAEYQDLVDEIYKRKLNPEVITLGSLRYEDQVVPLAQERYPRTDLFDFPLVKEGADKQRLSYDMRLKMYKKVVSRIRYHAKKQPIALCKERDQMWLQLGFKMNDSTQYACNCNPKWTFKDIREQQGVPEFKGDLPEPEFHDVSLSKIVDDPKHQYRRPDTVEGLKKSVAMNGVLYPIDLVKIKSGKFQVVDGFRRRLAATALGHKTIKARVYDKLTDKEAQRIKATANCARRELGVLDTFFLFADYRDSGWKVDEIADATGLQKRQVKKYSVIYGHKEARKKLEAGELGVEEAYLVAQDKKIPNRKTHPEIRKALDDAAKTGIGKNHSLKFSVQSVDGGIPTISISGLATNNLDQRLIELKKILKHERVIEAVKNTKLTVVKKAKKKSAKKMKAKQNGMGNRTYHRDKCAVFLKTKEAFGGLSNMAGDFPLEVNSVPIRNSEALYHALYFPHQPDVQRLIFEKPSPMIAKRTALGQRKEQGRSDWDKVRVPIMRWCLRVKLAQNWDEYGDLLRSTGKRPIVEESKKDDFWGAKPQEDGTLIGENMLGRLLTELRDDLKKNPDSLRRVEPLKIPNFLLDGRKIRLIK